MLKAHWARLKRLIFKGRRKLAMLTARWASLKSQADVQSYFRENVNRKYMHVMQV